MGAEAVVCLTLLLLLVGGREFVFVVVDERWMELFSISCSSTDANLAWPLQNICDYG